MPLPNFCRSAVPKLSQTVKAAAAETVCRGWDPRLPSRGCSPRAVPVARKS